MQEEVQEALSCTLKICVLTNVYNSTMHSGTLNIPLIHTVIYLGLFSNIRAVVELPTAGFFLTERNLGLEFWVVDEGLSPVDLRLKSPVRWV